MQNNATYVIPQKSVNRLCALK